MYSVDMYGRVRHACHVEGMSVREAAGVERKVSSTGSESICKLGTSSGGRMWSQLI